MLNRTGNEEHPLNVTVQTKLFQHFEFTCNAQCEFLVVNLYLIPQIFPFAASLFIFSRIREVGSWRHKKIDREQGDNLMDQIF